MGVNHREARSLKARGKETTRFTKDNRAVAQRNLVSILDAAERLIEQGTPATIAAVAAKSGLSRVTVYAHFRTRGQLLSAVGERSAIAVSAALDAAELDQGSAADALERGISLAWQFLGHHLDMAQATGTYLSSAARRRLHEAVLVRVQQLIERGRRQGKFRTDLPTEWLLASFYALIHAAADEVQAGRLKTSVAPKVLQRTVRDLLMKR